MDRLRAFEVFVTVVSKQGFARAADALDTSPANVTLTIRSQGTLVHLLALGVLFAGIGRLVSISQVGLAIAAPSGCFQVQCHAT